MPATPDLLLKALDDLGIDCTTHDHPALMTVGDSKALRGDLPGQHCKNLFLKDKKGRLWLVVAREDTPIDLKALRHVIGAAPLSFGKPELLMDTLGVTPGSVTPFAVINDSAKQVTVVLEAAMMAAGLLNYHPLTNTQTTALAPAGLERFLDWTGHHAMVVSL